MIGTGSLECLCGEVSASEEGCRIPFGAGCGWVHLDTVLETDAGKLPLLHGMEERAGVRRCLASKPDDAGLPSEDFLKCPSPRPSPRSFVAGRGSCKTRTVSRCTGRGGDRIDWINRILRPHSLLILSKFNRRSFEPRKELTIARPGEPCCNITDLNRQRWWSGREV